jgi:hypothetical protein
MIKHARIYIWDFNTKTCNSPIDTDQCPQANPYTHGGLSITAYGSLDLISKKCLTNDA